MADSGSGGGRQSRHRQHQQQPSPQQQQQHHQQQQQQQQQQYYEEVSHLNRVSSGKSTQFAGTQPHYDGSGSGRGNDKKQQRHHGDNRFGQLLHFFFIFFELLQTARLIKLTKLQDVKPYSRKTKLAKKIQVF